jgi:ketosteroid isomerase-like protein
MSDHAQALQSFYEALNRGDVEAALMEFDADVVRTGPQGFPGSGTYRGIQALRALIIKGRGNWAEGSCMPESFLAQSDKVVVRVHVRVRLKNASGWIDARIADGFRFQGGRIAEFITFVDRAEAEAWAVAGEMREG